FYALAVYLENERWLDAPITPSARSRGESWIVLDTPDLEPGWLGTRPQPVRIEAIPTAGRRRRSRTISPSLRFEVFRRDGSTCQYCGRRAPHVVLHVDHVKAVAIGGTNDPDNLIAACSVCNIGKGARSLAGC